MDCAASTFYKSLKEETKVSNTQKYRKHAGVPDYERWMRQLLAGIKSVRRWKKKEIFSQEGFFGNGFNWLRAYLFLPVVNFFVKLFSQVARFVDPWNATPENVLEHSFKQAMIIQKMLAIEIYRGNRHHLDCYRLLQYAINHDLAESVVGDILYHEKLKNKEHLDKKEFEAYQKIIENGVKDDYSIYFSFPFGRTDLGDQAEMAFWDVSEKIGYCYFMLEEILYGRLSKKEAYKFYCDVRDHHLPELRKYENRFASVKEIIHHEIIPKLDIVEFAFDK